MIQQLMRTVNVILVIPATQKDLICDQQCKILNFKLLIFYCLIYKFAFMLVILTQGYYSFQSFEKFT